MVLEYWHDNGYSGIKGVSYYGSETEFINHIAVDMDTGIYGTMAPEWANGIEVHANTYASYSFDTLEDDSPDYAEYVTSIGNEEPVGVMWDRFSSHPELEWHWTVGRGYYPGESINEIKLNDPQMEGPRTIWVDFNEYVDDMDFVYVEP